MLEKANLADLIWDHIQIQYAAIIRAQQIMYVSNQEDMTKELRRESYSPGEGGSSSMEEYEIQFAWDNHASFLNAQSWAMSEFRSLIKQFCDMTGEDDERRLKLKQMRRGIERLRQRSRSWQATMMRAQLKFLSSERVRVNGGY